MRKAILPPPPVSTLLYNLGNNEVQKPILDVSLSMGSHQLVNGYGGGFCLEPKIFNGDNQLRSGGFAAAIPHQSPFRHQPVAAGYQSTSSNCDNITQQSMLRFQKKDSIPGVDMDFSSIRKRKRCNEVSRLLPRKGRSDVADYENAASSTENWKTNKRKKAASASYEEQCHHQAKESINIQEKLRVPVRRSQKLSDKITALQKLVSPYGKTDTASVLQEASLYIKLLQHQIQNLFEMLRCSYNNNLTSPRYSQEINDDKQQRQQLPDLKSRGLCLVPISLFTSKFDTGRPHSSY